MVPLKDNNDLECYLVTKHSWKGKYKRILSIGSAGISTYNPDKFEITNRWGYNDVMAVAPTKTAATPSEFQLIVRKDRKTDSIKLSSEYRSDILTSMLRFYKEFGDKNKGIQKYDAKKHHWSGISFPTVLEVTPCSLDQLDPTTNTILASYNYKDINGIIGVNDYEGGIVIAYGSFSRLHVFKALNHHEIVQNIVVCANQFLSIDIKVLKSQITLLDVEMQRFGQYSKDQSLTSLSEFIVQKITHRHPEPVKRILCLTDATVLERDPQTYSLCTLRPLVEAYALVRDADNIQLFSIEYKNGQVRSYLTNDRDSLLATLLDSIRSCGNPDVHVRITRTPRGKRVVPLSVSVDEETEANLLKMVIHNFQYPTKRFEIMERFNANIPHSGLNYSVTQDSLFAENKEKLITGALQALTQKESEAAVQLNNFELEASFHTLRRLLASKVGFAAFTNLPGFREIIGQKVVASLRRNDLAVTYAAIDMLNSLMHSTNADYDLKQEQLNKSSLLSSKSFMESLLDMWTEHVKLGSGALVLSAMLDFLTFALCVPYSETTDGKQFDVLLEMVAGRGRSLYRLFQHSSLAIVKGAGLVLRAIIEEGETTVANHMQTLALDEAALCRHLLVALFTPTTDVTMATHRQLSKHLVGLWITDNEDALQLLRRIFPDGLLTYLESEDTVPKVDVEDDKLNFRDNLKLAIQHSNKNRSNIIEKHLEGIKHWGLNLIDRQEKVNQAMKNRPIVLRNRRQKKKTTDTVINLPLFFYQFLKDHNIPNLIWNHKTREELRISLDKELHQFQSDKELSGNTLVAWNYEEFEVHYQCLADEIKIGDYYIRLILEQDDWPHNLVKNPVELFNALYRRVLCRNRINDDQLTVTSLQALAKVYKRYYEDIGYFSDITYILQLLDRSLSPALRDALLGLIKCLVLNKSNCRPLIDHVNYLVDLITLAHLHRGRAMPNTKTNVIEAGPNQHMHEEKDWYYNKDGGDKPERCGPVSFSELKELWTKKVLTPKTRCWATGMEGWRSLQQIPQLKWYLMASGTSIYNETELASHILDILIKCTSFFPSRARDGKAVLIPGPKMSRKISEFICLPHIVQVCLTHDPGLLERVATLLCQIMEDNSELPKVYLTGVFYFMLMYTGSNILPIARFLKLTHMKQAFRNEETTQSEIMNRSILGQLLPEAMICFLENHSAEKFAETFLGEFDTPEVIWNSEMRRLLIERIAAHLADFTPRLRGHTMARYPYLAIPVISYPQLEHELFCHIFYLRHLCDERMFPNWPIAEPVQLLRHTLEAWRKEVEKKPSQMTVHQAYEDLGIDLVQTPAPDEALIRKAYYRLAQKYHPDKNPAGRDRFVKVNLAYEFLCSRSVWTSDGPNPSNIVLILRTQSILFDRYTDELRPYKYAGYPQLIKTIRLETQDEQLFSKEVPLLTAASELCYHTVHCSALNAEELRRENGIETLLEAYSRCVSIMSVDSKPAQVHYEIISNITRCFEVACNFENCKNKIIELPQLIVDVSRVVYFKHSLSVSLVTSLAANNYNLQCNLVKSGVIWSLLLFLFDYDYTLDESGVVTDEKTNQQKMSNNLAKLSILAVVALAGYDMKLVLDATDPLNTVIRSQQTTPKNNSLGSASSSPLGGSSTTASRHNSVHASAPTPPPQPPPPIPPLSSSSQLPSSTSSVTVNSASAYTSNAQNVIQNSLHLVQSAVIAATTSSSSSSSSTTGANFKSYVNFADKNGGSVDSVTSTQQNGDIVAAVEKENTASNKKYSISGTASNAVVKRILDRLLTQFVANKLAGDSEMEVLKLLTSNTRNPYLIWENATRAQLLEFLEYQRLKSSKEQYEDITDIHDIVADFSFDAHRDELQIGSIYIRIYNEMPTFPIQNCKSFVVDLLEYLKQGYQFLCGQRTVNNKSASLGGQILQPTLAHNHPQLQPKPKKSLDGVLSDYNRARARSTKLEAVTVAPKCANGGTVYDFAGNAKAVDHIVMVLRSFISVIKSNANVEIQCIGHFEMLFGLLSTTLCDRDYEIKSLALEIVSLVSRNKECVSEIAACEILGHFLVALRDPELRDMTDRVLETLSGLLNVQRMVKEAHNKGVIIYLLDLFANSRNPQIREQCAEILGKMTTDKLTGPKVRISVSKFVPTVFLDAMIESPAISVQMFESTHEHPELIWNEKTRDRVIAAISKTVEKFYKAQKQNPQIVWKDSDTLQEILTTELVVSGVYLKLFITNPGWTLRKPKQFLSDLLDFVADNIGRSGSEQKDALDTSTTALVSLLNAQPNLADAVPVLGHIPKFFRQLTVQPKSALRVLQQLSISEICVTAIAQTDCISALKKCMETNRDLTAVVCETLSRLFKSQHDTLIRQSLECSLIPYMLKLLEQRMEFTENPSMVKAQIVNALKAMTHNLTYGDQVTHILNSNPIWAEYRDQKHDLFITDTNVRGYLTGNPTAGYLTQGPSKNIEVLTSPPPMDRDDPLARNSTE